MKQPNPIPEAFWPLLDAACDDVLTESQIAELAVILESDPNACDMLVDHMQLQDGIRLLHQSQTACDIGIARIQASLDTRTYFRGGSLSHRDAPSLRHSVIFRRAGRWRMPSPPWFSVSD